MPIEYEKRTLISKNERGVLSARLWARGFRRMGIYLQRRVVFDIRPGDEAIWGRLRDDGESTVLTVKEVRADGFVNETETTVGDWDSGLAMITALGFQVRSYQENRRRIYRPEDDGLAEVMIDEWPRLGTVVEVEGQSPESIDYTQSILYLDGLTTDSITQLYRDQGIDVMRTERLAFEDPS